MATNDFLKFNESNTNMQDLAAYTADAMRQDGFPFGSKPPSNLTNRFYRDTAGFVYAFGEFMKAQGVNASPDDLAALIANIPLAVGASAIPQATNSAGTDAYVLTLAGITAYNDGQIVKMRTSVANTGAATLNINAIGAKAIGYFRGGVYAPTATGAIPANAYVLLMYSTSADGGAGAWIIQNILDAPAGAFVGDTDVQTISGKTFTAPKFANGGYISDPSGNEFLKFMQAGSAVNEISIGNRESGLPPQIISTGSDTNIDMNLLGKGSGKVLINGSTSIRLNGTLLEYWDGGAWSLVGLICTKPRAFSYVAAPGTAYVQILSVSGKGKVSGLSLFSGSGVPSLEITVDGVVQTEETINVNAPIPVGFDFLTSFVLKTKNTSGAAVNNVRAEYALV